jgi:hypothetical protein
VWKWSLPLLCPPSEREKRERRKSNRGGKLQEMEINKGEGNKEERERVRKRFATRPRTQHPRAPGTEGREWEQWCSAVKAGGVGCWKFFLARTS